MHQMVISMCAIKIKSNKPAIIPAGGAGNPVCQYSLIIGFRTQHRPTSVLTPFTANLYRTYFFDLAPVYLSTITAYP
jgi:hypothetical protein